jgi:hypothetical protein
MKVKAKKNGKIPGVRDAIKAIQDIPEKNLKRKKNVESSDSEPMEKNPVTPKPFKKNLKSRVPIESDVDSDLPRPPKRASVVRPALNDEGDDLGEDLPPKKGAKKNKGKGKMIQQEPDNLNKGKATDKGADQPHGGNIPKLKMYVLPIHRLVTCLYFL